MVWHNVYGISIFIIVTIYNIEIYLKESVLNQCFDFKSNVWLILVGDKSTDNSFEIAMHYQNLYLENIFLDESISITEYPILINQLLINKEQYAVLSKIEYLYWNVRIFHHNLIRDA